jgi:hypothetical protein
MTVQGRSEQSRATRNVSRKHRRRVAASGTAVDNLAPAASRRQHSTSAISDVDDEDPDQLSERCEFRKLLESTELRQQALYCLYRMLTILVASESRARTNFDDTSSDTEAEEEPSHAPSPARTSPSPLQKPTEQTIDHTPTSTSAPAVVTSTQHDSPDIDHDSIEGSVQLPEIGKS